MNRYFALSALLIAAVNGPAAAEPVEVVVTLSKSDLASAKMLNRRLAGAVEQACGSYASIEPYQWPEMDQCRKSAWSSVNRQLAALRQRNDVALSAR